MDKIITDWSGKIIGVIKKDGDKSITSNWTGKRLGSADENGTKDFIGKKISPENVPDIFLGGS